MDKVRKFLSSIAWIFSEELARIWLIPLVPTVGVGVIGWVQSIQWFYYCIGMTVMFAAVTTILFRISEWKLKVTAKDKLAFASIRFIKNLSADGVLAALQLGFQVNNHALFPIQFAIREMQTELTDKFYPAKKPYAQDTLTISVNGRGWFDDNPISLDKNKVTLLRNRVVEGLMYVRLAYGRPDNLKYEMEIKKKIFVLFTENGDVRLSHWYDI